MVTSTPSAEYGRAGNAVIDLAANEFHGAAFYFLRAENLDGALGGEPRRPGEGRLQAPPVRHRPDHHQGQATSSSTPSCCASPDDGGHRLHPYQAFRDSVTNPDIAQIFNTYYPLPNSDQETDISGRYVWSHAEPQNFEQYVAKVDYNFNEAHAFSFRYVRNTGTDPYTTAPGGGYLPTFQNTQGVLGTARTFGAEWTYIVNPTMVNS